jgi:PAS domain S-box-containing protein
MRGTVYSAPLLLGFRTGEPVAKPERPLRNSATLLSALLEGGDDFIAIYDMKYRFIVFNAAFEREFKRIFNTRIKAGMSLLDALARAPSFQAMAIKLAGRALSGEEITTRGEFGRGRSRRFVEQRLRPIRDNRGRQIGVQQVVRDLTASRRTERVTNAESELARLQALLNCMTEAIVIVEPSGKIILANPAALTLHDFSSLDEARQHVNVMAELFETRYPDGRLMDMSEWPAVRAIRGETLNDIEILVRNRRTGKSFIGSYSASPLRNEIGETILIAITIRDITEQRRMELVLRESEERARLAMQAARMYAFDWNPDTDEVRRSSNCAEILGLTADATRSTGTACFQQIHPEDRDRFIRTVTTLTPANDSYVIQFRFMRYDGKVLSFEESGRGFFDAGGRMTLLIGMVADVTAHRQAESALLESEERFWNMADAAPVMIWVSGPDKLGAFFNKGWLDFTGRTREQELGHGWAEGVHPDDLGRCLAIYFESFDARRSFAMEYRLRRADGEYRWVLDNGVPRFQPGGAFAGYIGSCIDITDLKRAQVEALARQKLECVGVLASGIAHDFNNLLGSVLAGADLALADLAPGMPAIEEIQRIKVVALRASEIVRELMIYSGQEPPTLQPVDISSLVEEMLELIKVSISKHAALVTKLGRNLPAVLANPAQIRQVVMNLITNASEAIGQLDGEIRVKTERVTLPEGERLRLEVSDTGCGMTAETQARIFDPFFTTKFAGRGLGLAVVDAIVRSHAGGIHIVSAPSQGTTFEILFPTVTQPPLKEQNAPAAAPPGRVPSGATTILIVEDEETIRLAVSKMLRKRGLSVIEAADGGAAIDLLRAHANEIGVILLDMTLPGTSSREVFDEARRLRSDIKAILTSAYSREIAARDWPQVEDFIRKPYQIYELVRLLQTVLSR